MPSMQEASSLRELTCHMGSQSTARNQKPKKWKKITQCYLPLGRGDIPPSPQLKLVLDVATPEGSKTEFT